MKKSAWRAVAAGAIVAAGLCWVTFVFALSLTVKDVTGRDYIEYWAAGRQVIHHANPYDPSAILRLEQSAGMERDQPEVSPSPPLVLLLTAPLGFFSAEAGLILWFALLLASLSGSLWILWLLHGKPDTLLYLFGFLFAPAIACLQCGQISIFLLLSIMASLYFLESRPWLAGMLLVPLTVKPHLFLPFAVALVLWVLYRRAFGVPAGFFVGLSACLALTFYLDQHAWAQYFGLLKQFHLLVYPVPTLSGTLQRLISVRMSWLRFLPDAAASLWAIWYFRSRRDHWNWAEQGMVALLVSILCAPYAFFYDECILLPAVLSGVILAKESGRSLWPIAILCTAALIEVFRSVPVTSLSYLWTTPAWLLWYLYATRPEGRIRKPAPHFTTASH